jgi:aminomuconate-semialdehyde/2-hydroxymuconate-6-semialdehyde dehydrogenase
MRQIENFIAGEFVAAASGKRFDKHSPLDNRIICSVSEAGRGEVDAAVRPPAVPCRASGAA